MRPITSRNFYAGDATAPDLSAKFIRPAGRPRLELTLAISAEMYSIGEFDERYPIGRRITAEVWRMCHRGWGGTSGARGRRRKSAEGRGRAGAEERRREDDNQLADNRLFIGRDFVGVIALTTVATSSNFKRTRARSLSPPPPPSVSVSVSVPLASILFVRCGPS